MVAACRRQLVACRHRRAERAAGADAPVRARRANGGLMDLILWRHAEAALLREGQDDLQRPLTAKGERQAQRMAEWLNQRLAHSTRILASPALRTQQTAKALGKTFKTVEALAPDASVEAILKAARWPDASESVL